MLNSKDLDDLYLDALGYYASLSVISVLASYVLKILYGSNLVLPWIIMIILSSLILALLAFFSAIYDALSNKIWKPILKLSKENPKSFSARIGHDVLVILYFAIIILPPFYTIFNVN